jgi:hypothetical protein
MDLSRLPISQVPLHRSPGRLARCPVAAVLGGTVLDLLFIGLTIAAFAVLWLLVKGVERFER